MSSDGPASGSRVRNEFSVAIGVVGLLLVLAWWWPGLTGRGQSAEVTIIGTGDIASARDVISRRVREAGLSVRWEDSITTWCDAASVLSDDDVVVVLAPDDLVPCRTAGEVFDETLVSPGEANRLVLVSSLGSSAGRILESNGARRVPTERLIGGVDEQVPCVWWDDCPDSGLVVTRTESGLTDAGRQRLARLIVTRLP